MHNKNTSLIKPTRYVFVSIAEQRLLLIDNDSIEFDVSIATGKNGAGEQFGSECTPRGWHSVRAKIGQHCAENTVFVGRRPTGEIYSEHLQAEHPGRDWILTRILWLNGLEPGFNRSGTQDTMRRYIYIHGCPDSHPMGIPSSHGCIKMRNSDMIELFDRIDVGIAVLISEDKFSSIAQEHDIANNVPDA
ncbi:L,D-transpeptidase [sulfur-oxidizing endosymbiont of Gigantopelta aegis]|uniref:L,D-transpeptidase n=1 Tax=sulfur-oxidizing endosymbiont of Gigantopelta aegis TaxID=2794934 RepID=UPI0018DC81C9|nr:L,D-transpeptidase [sulfur-oxidizing endosymbiont of Gigantopelta aegis]